MKNNEAPASPPAPAPLDLGVIGNCRVAALVNPLGRIVWWCVPRFDGDPVFCNLLSGKEEKGFCEVFLEGMSHYHSEYRRNTAVIETVLTDSAGNSLRISDFAPRFKQFGRHFRPATIVRRIEPIAGLPRIRLRVRPTHDYGKPCHAIAGSNHIRFVGSGPDPIRLTTDASLSYVLHESPFVLSRPLHLIFGPDEPLNDAPDTIAPHFLEKTIDYWTDWVRALAIPYEWQSETIRAAITLKLCSFEETGAVVAAHTTSVSEAPDSERNWDYRFCWLRDAYFVIQALNRLGATKTMESYIDYIATIAASDAEGLRPLYGIVHDMPTEERIAPELEGFLGQAPVRVGNQAAEQLQNDVYGSVILAVAQSFADQRLPIMGDEGLYRRLEPLGRKAARFAFEPDAGIWEFRGRTRVHTHSALLCWVACDGLCRIARRIGLAEDAQAWARHATEIRKRLLAEAWNEERGAFTGYLGGHELDASVLLMAELGLIAADDPRYASTVETIRRELTINGQMLRYAAPDDFGPPETAFLVVKFWTIDALAAMGRRDEARELFAELLAVRNSYGLLSEDLHPITGQLWGNLPQTYSMAGIVNSAMRLSISWEEGLWLASS
ncbi:MAG: glycoside hydrolase family 15 protein [Burkholderiaceae bacterium]